MKTVSADLIVKINPGVIGTGGNPLALNGVFLDKSTALPGKGIEQFYTADDVGAYFGLTSKEYELAQIYFNGFTIATKTPGSLFIAPYNDSARAARLVSGSFKGEKLTVITGLAAGTITLEVDGVSQTSSSIDLSAATSFSNAASIIQATLTGVTVTYDSIRNVFKIDTTSAGVESIISPAVSGTLADGLKLSADFGGVARNGADADTQASALTNVRESTLNWAAFTTIWKATDEEKEAFSEWSNGTNNRFGYICWDDNAQAKVSGSTCFGNTAKINQYDSVAVLYRRDKDAAAVLGVGASIDYSRLNGRIDFAFKAQSGLPPIEVETSEARNLLANGYSFYARYSTANDAYNFLYNGNMPGKFKYLDSWYNQVWLNSGLQLSIFTYMLSVNSLPYNQTGYSGIRLAMYDVIRQGVTNGVIQTGVTLSESQKNILRQQAGLDISSELQTFGYYLQILDPGAQARGNRQSPIVNLWYTDGGSIQQITVASTNIL